MSPCLRGTPGAGCETENTWVDNLPMTRQALAPEAATLAVPLWRRILVYGFFGVFALWCIKAFWHDITQIDLSPLHSGWPAVVVAGLLSLLNYGLRVVRCPRVSR